MHADGSSPAGLSRLDIALLGFEFHFLRENAMLMRLPGRRLPFWAGALFGIGVALAEWHWLGLALRMLAGEVLVLAAILWRVHRGFRNDFTPPNGEELELTQLSDGELAYGMLTRTLMPVVWLLTGLAVAETAALLYLGFGERQKLGELLVVLVFPALFLVLHCATIPALAPRLAFSEVAARSARHYVGLQARALSESFVQLAVLYLLSLFGILLAAAFLLLLKIEFSHGILLFSIVALILFKRGPSTNEDFKLPIASSWREWLAERRGAA
ncbi:MAG: hypothetical protein RLY93_06865 [Sumerlaeia bacterium]